MGISPTSATPAPPHGIVSSFCVTWTALFSTKIKKILKLVGFFIFRDMDTVILDQGNGSRPQRGGSNQTRGRVDGVMDTSGQGWLPVNIYVVVNSVGVAFLSVMLEIGDRFQMSYPVPKDCVSQSIKVKFGTE
ncbi:hypothetical protein OUZ56_024434 [Daphnia magna]|uniref:Uncharacterized protein n=1 Tax=Daphnia magna TaxID=35525 RepID=A0ABR0B0U6_9CRUS|nr:hypothetical protein OUZ56_024434 [Daphnia magna]